MNVKVCLVCLKAIENDLVKKGNCDLPIFTKFLKFAENYLRVSSVATKRLLRAIGEGKDGIFCENCELTVISPICRIYSQLICAQARLSVELERLHVLLEDSTESPSTKVNLKSPTCSLDDNEILRYFKPFRSSLTEKCQLKNSEFLPRIILQRLTVAPTSTPKEESEVDDDFEAKSCGNSDLDNSDSFEPLDLNDDVDDDDSLHLPNEANPTLQLDIKIEDVEEVDDPTFQPESNSKRKRKLMKKMPFSCPNCSKLFPKRYNLSRHLKLVHGEDPIYFPCSACELEFTSPKKLWRHKRTAHELRPHRCSLCEMSYRTESGLEYHVDTVHKQQTFPCTHCSSVFSHRSNLRNHLFRIHPETQASAPPPSMARGEPLSCPTCGKVFSTPGKVSAHIRAVHREKRFSCPECDLVVKLQYQLNRHIKEVHNPQTHICHHCGKTLSTETNVKQHIKRFHPTPAQKERWVKCPNCREPFFQNYLMKIHLRSCSLMKSEETQNAGEQD